jgi:hypothetical protein
VHSLYIPYWTFDARVHCPWQADAGYYYYETVRGKRQRRVRWEPAAGAIDHAFDDEPVPGTQGIDARLLRKVEPFPTGECVAYDTAFLAGHVVEHYKVVLLEAAKQSQEQMHTKLLELCGRQVPGDTHRNLRIFPTFSGQTFKHLLVPIWLLTYNFRSRAYQVIANGYTGKIAGEYPWSWWKVLLLIILAFIVLYVISVAEDAGIEFE